MKGLHDGRFDLEHPSPGVAEVLGEVEVGEDLPDLLTGHIVPDVVPLGVAEQVGDDPGALLAGPLVKEVENLRLGDLLIRKKVEGPSALDAIPTATCTLHDLSIMVSSGFARPKRAGAPLDPVAPLR